MAIFAGFGVGLLYKAAYAAFRLWKDVPEKIFGAPLAAGSIAVDASPELLGVGYIIGPRIASIMCAGGVLSYLLLIPMIKFFGEAATTAIAPGTIPISQMSPNQIRSAYVLYIGAGAVAAGGLISLARSLPTIWHGLRAGLRDARSSRSDAPEAKLNAVVPRTDQDLPMSFVGIGLIVLMVGIVATPTLHMNVLGALLDHRVRVSVRDGFLAADGGDRVVFQSDLGDDRGDVVVHLFDLFCWWAWTGGGYYVTALSIGAIVCIASSNGGTTLAGFEDRVSCLASTPKYQQVAILFGAFASALVLGPILLKLNDAKTVYVPAAQVGTRRVDGPIRRGCRRTRR